MAEQDKLLERLHVYDTDLSVRIPRKTRSNRKSAKPIDDIVNSYAKIFKGRKSDKEILYMALIDGALRYEEERESDRKDTETCEVIFLRSLPPRLRRFELRILINIYII